MIVMVFVFEFEWLVFCFGEVGLCWLFVGIVFVVLEGCLYLELLLCLIVVVWYMFGVGYVYVVEMFGWWYLYVDSCIGVYVCIVVVIVCL